MPGRERSSGRPNFAELARQDLEHKRKTLEMEAKKEGKEPAEFPLEFAGNGNDQLVYFLKKIPEQGELNDDSSDNGSETSKEARERGIVAKVPMRPARNILCAEVIRGADPETVAQLELKDEAVHPLLQRQLPDQEEIRVWLRFLERKMEDHQRSLKKHFTSKHVLGQRVQIETVPVSKPLVKEVLREEGLEELDPGTDIEIQTIVRYQEKIPPEAQEKIASLGFRYAERFNMVSSDYLALNEMTIQDNQEFNEEFFAQFLHEGTRRLLISAKEDERARGLLVDFVRRTIAFTQESGFMLDLAGAGNVRAFEKGDEWTYLIVDPDAGGDWKEAQRKFAALINQPNIREAEAYRGILNELNYARTLNGLAKSLGMTERLEFLSDEHKNEDIGWVFSDYMNQAAIRIQGQKSPLEVSSRSSGGNKEHTQVLEPSTTIPDSPLGTSSVDSPETFILDDDTYDPPQDR